MFTRPHIRQGNTHGLGGPSSLTGHLHKPGPGLKDRIVGAFIAVRSEPGYTQPDDILLDRLERFIIDSEFFIIPGKLIGRKNIGVQLLYQGIKDLPPFRLSQIQRQGLFAGIDAEEIGIHPFLAKDIFADQPVGIPINGMLQPDDLHAIVRQSVG